MACACVSSLLHRREQLSRPWRMIDLWARPPTLWLSVAKGSIAVTLAMLLTFARAFDELIAHPVALNGMMLVVICGAAGKSVGGCTLTVLLGCAGLGCGVLGFYVLGVLSAAPVAQGFLFAIFVYLMALVRAGGPKYIAFYLYAVLFAFNGIWYPISASTPFESSYLLAFFQAYAFGLLIVIAVNLVVWPFSAERELRHLLVQSLQHVSTLAHLACKTYAKEIEEDEVEVRELLVRTIRSDYLSLASHLEETSYEVLWSRWAYADLLSMIGHVKGLQQALITSSSALELIDTLDPHGTNARKHLFARAEAAQTFGAFRYGLDLVISDLIDELLGPNAHKHCVLPEDSLPDPREPTDLEKAGPPKLGRRETRASEVQQIATVGARLQREVLRSEHRHEQIRHHRQRSIGASIDQPRPLPTQHPEPPSEELGRARDSSPAASSSTAVAPDGEPDPRALSPVAYLHQAWQNFSRAQNDALVRLIKDGALQVDDELEVDREQPSMQDLYKARLPKAWTSSLVSSKPMQQRRRSTHSAASAMSHHQGFIEEEGDEEDDLEDNPITSEDVPCSEALTKNYSLAFGFNQLADELIALHKLVKSPAARNKLQFHIIGTFKRHIEACCWWRKKEDMSLQEALASLRGEEYRAPPKPWISYLIKAEKWLRGDRSLYAAKVALGASVYTALLLAPATKDVLFLKIGQVSALITIVVAIAPTMGGTLSTWILQLSGTGIGALYGLIILEIFRGVGGYVFNPFGLTVFVGLWSIPHAWLFYKYPKWYTGSLLMMTGTSGMLTLEWLYNELPELERPYDSPALRFGYTLASLAISISISAIIQLFIFRSPARHKLRQAMASVTFKLSSYNLLLINYINLVVQHDEAPQPPKEALDKVWRELVKREGRIQTAVLGLNAMFEFAKVEPNFAQPFKGEVLKEIMRSHQIMLDRLREARTAVGQGFGFTIHHDFASKLWPYRIHAQRLGRTLFYLSATSLSSKTPLPRDVPSTKDVWKSFEHDALVLSRRLSMLPKGEEELKRPSFLRYWFYLVAFGAVSTELEELEKHLAALFGSPELTNPMMA